MSEKITTKEAAGVQAPRGPLVRPVSQVSLTLSDQNAFDVAIRESVKWMNGAGRCAGAIPREAVSGASFDLTHRVGALPAMAESFCDEERRLWAAKFDFPDRAVGQRTWSTEISIATAGPTTQFVARLTNITRAEDRHYAPSVPGVVRQIVSKLSAEADNFPISDEVFDVDEHSAADFEYLLLRRDRRLPIIALSQTEKGATLLDPSLLTRRLAGAAHVMRLDPAVSWQITRSWGKRASVFGGAVRLYWPDFSPDNDDPHRHPLTRYSSDFDARGYADWLCRRIFPTAFAGPQRDDSFPRLADLRALASKKQREEARGTKDLEQLQALVRSLEESLGALEQQRTEDGQAAQALLDEAANAQHIAEEERDELSAENSRLRTKLHALTRGRASDGPAERQSLTTYDEFETWCDNTLGDRIEVLARAIRETEKHGEAELLGKLEETLLLIRDYYVPMRLEGGTDRRKRFEEECERVGVEESACFARRNDIRAFPEYRANFDGRQIWLDRHFKYGRGYEGRRMFRIYFTWDEQTQSVVIGHMPTHLDNNNTQ